MVNSKNYEGFKLILLVSLFGTSAVQLVAFYATISRTAYIINTFTPYYIWPISTSPFYYMLLCLKLLEEWQKVWTLIRHRTLSKPLCPNISVNTNY